MKVEILDQDTFNSVKPEALLNYLSINGWKEVRRVEGELFVLSKATNQSKNQLIWVPISSDYSDYAPMVARLVKTVADVEQLSELQVLDDLQTTAIGDVIRVGTADPLNIHDHTIPLPEGVVLLNKARSMALAGASSAVNRRPVHPRRPAANASRFVRNLRLGQTERGSFLIKLIAPLLEEERQLTRDAHSFEESTPFARRAVLELVRGLNALKQAAEENKSDGRFVFNPFLNAVSSGVSANLCEALILQDERQQVDKPLEISVTWSYAIPERNNLPLEPIRFEGSTLPYIRQAAKEFRVRNPEIITIQGWVNILERNEQVGPGLIRIYCSLDGKQRAVRVQLEKVEEYNKAIDAHKNGHIVAVTGTLIVEGQSYRIESPSNFQVMEQLDFLDDDEDLRI